jgi:hypothetical protein
VSISTGVCFFFAQPLEHFPSIHAGQHHIEQHCIVIVNVRLVEAVLARFSGIHGVAFLAQALGEVAKQTGLVFNDQNSHRRFGSER